LRFDLLLFDLDGTLVDSLPDIASALNRVLVGAGLQKLPVDVVRTLVGEGVLRLVEKALAVQSADRDATALARQVVADYSERPCVQTRVFPGVEGAVQRLHAAGVRLAVVTNKVGTVARVLLNQLHMKDSFDAVVGEGDGYARKPSPDAALGLIGRFGVTPERTLMIGDGLPDVAMARAAGCKAAAVTWGYSDRAALEAQGPDFIVEATGDLESLISPGASTQR
jgi:phosphoglycolate phosphatase